MAQRSSSTTPAAPASPTLKSFNPQTGAVMREIQTHSPEEVREAVERARKVAPEWAAIPPEGRANILREVRYRMYELMDEIVETVASETGKPRTEALAHDVLPTLLQFLWYEKTAAKALKPQKIGRIAGPLLGMASHIEWRPFGVVGCITPWNYPITNCFLAVTAPLFAGNVVVIKPSEVTPGCGELIKQILEPLPAGVATVVQGGGDVGAALVDAPCDKISFVGSPATGRKICEAAAKHLTPVVMELGGKDATIVLEDADLDVASSGVLWGSFFNAGQTCYSIERAFVVDAVADEFKAKLLEKVATIKQESDADVGTLSFKRQLEIVSKQVEDATAKGAKVLAGGPGAGHQNADGTLWYAPTIIEGVTPDMSVVKEESFGPILALTRVRDEAEAIDRANEGPNLTASVWTKDKRAAVRVAEQLRAGSVTVNDLSLSAGAPWGPWGGVGESGYGRLNGELGLREFSVPVHVQRNTMPGMKRLHWYPYSDATQAVLRAATDLVGNKKLGAKVSAVGRLAKNAGRTIKDKI